MVNPGNKAEEIRHGLAALVGQRLLRSRNLFATRMFLFGQSSLQVDSALYTLGLECPWRVEKHDVILAGAEDYYEKAEANTDESWEAGMPSGHLQDQGLVELLGELREGYIINTGAGLVVESVEGDRFGGFRIGMSESCVLEVFPASRNQMEWIFSPPIGGSLILMNGALERGGQHPDAKELPSRV
jgi:hypothetical protein